MDASRWKRGADALRGYVVGDLSEPAVLSEFKGVPPEERADLVRRHRSELARIDGARLVILESMLLPLAERAG